MSDGVDAGVLGSALAALLSELVEGPQGTGAYMLNRGDTGLLGSLGRLDWHAAAHARDGASIAAHVDHLRYGLSLQNRNALGEPDVFAAADWGASWTVSVESEAEWSALLDALRAELRLWQDSLEAIGDRWPLDATTLREAVASVAHLAYHLGAIRQIDRSTRGPTDEELRSAR